MDRLDVMRLFVRVVETESFTRAARDEGLSQPTVSKQIAGLEARLEAQLLRRTSRGLSVTEAGQAYYEAAVRVIEDIEAAESSVGRGQSNPRGKIRVALSAGFGRMHVLPRLPEFLTQYRDLSIETSITDRHVNLIEGRIDVAIRIGRLADSSLVARRIGAGETALLAARSYVERVGVPKALEDIAQHQCIIFLTEGMPRTWEFLSPSGPVYVEPQGQISTIDAEHIRVAVLSGFGIVQGPTWLFTNEISAGSVVRLLPEFAPTPHPINAVSASGRLQSTKVKLFVDFLAEQFTADPYLQVGR